MTLRPALFAALALPLLAGCTTYADDYGYGGPQPGYGYPGGYQQGYGAQVSIRSVDEFYGPLSAYGSWRAHPRFGRVWQPRVAQGWRPYTLGRWDGIDGQRRWVSDEPFGWATYHYGRWGYDQSYGWHWVPDTQWGPGWVDWREADDFYGWAPLSPYGGIGVGLSYVFAPRAYLGRPQVWRYAVDQRRARDLYGRSRAPAWRDRDRDGIANRFDRDRNGNGIPNRLDGRDRDRDGIPNRFEDRDRDGVPNRFEDRDRDGVRNRFDRDRNGNGIPNRAERRDRDGDGIPNRVERQQGTFTPPTQADRAARQELRTERREQRMERRSAPGFTPNPDRGNRGNRGPRADAGTFGAPTQLAQGGFVPQAGGPFRPPPVAAPAMRPERPRIDAPRAQPREPRIDRRESPQPRNNREVEPRTVPQ